MSIRTRKLHTQANVTGKPLVTKQRGRQPLEIPTGMEVNWYELEEGNNYFDIIPYKIKGDNHPLVASGQVPVGEFDDSLIFFVHYDVNDNHDVAICNERMFGTPCPLCELQRDKMAELKASGMTGSDAWKEIPNSLKPKGRALWNVVDWKHRDKGIQLFTASQYVVENGIDTASKVDKEDTFNKITADTFTIFNPKLEADEEFIYFASPTNGTGIKITCEQDSFNGNTYNKPVSFSLVPRENQYGEDIVEKAYSLEQFINTNTYDEVFEMYYGFSRDSKDDRVKADATMEVRDEAVKPKMATPPKSEPVKDETPIIMQEEPEVESKCPYDRVFGADFDITAQECDDCMLSHTETYKECIKENQALKTL